MDPSPGAETSSTKAAPAILRRVFRERTQTPDTFARCRDGPALFDSGELRTATSSVDGRRIGDVVLRRGMVSGGRFQVALASDGNAGAAWEAPGRAGPDRPERARRRMRRLSEEIVFSTFTWKDGAFVFEDDEGSPTPTCGSSTRPRRSSWLASGGCDSDEYLETPRRPGPPPRPVDDPMIRYGSSRAPQEGYLFSLCMDPRRCETSFAWRRRGSVGAKILHALFACGRSRFRRTRRRRLPPPRARRLRRRPRPPHPRRPRPGRSTWRPLPTRKYATRSRAEATFVRASSWIRATSSARSCSSRSACASPRKVPNTTIAWRAPSRRIPGGASARSPSSRRRWRWLPVGRTRCGTSPSSSCRETERRRRANTPSCSSIVLPRIRDTRLFSGCRRRWESHHCRPGSDAGCGQAVPLIPAASSAGSRKKSDLHGRVAESRNRTLHESVPPRVGVHGVRRLSEGVWENSFPQVGSEEFLPVDGEALLLLPAGANSDFNRRTT